MRTRSGTIQVIDSFHRLVRLGGYSMVDFDGTPLAEAVPLARNP